MLEQDRAEEAEVVTYKKFCEGFSKGVAYPRPSQLWGSLNSFFLGYTVVDGSAMLCVWGDRRRGRRDLLIVCKLFDAHDEGWREVGVVEREGSMS